ncbi:uncharacterized protein N7496_006022 [Penicillium cataractarum]|uniref:Uncharacterized protein n=1 Tax=Penicillium cataractarum TaxID=2100454 RepID=A0A9W9S249_9EURO|nr:uncharacterized protein N7496_006022 [Penicillium cataractarum]KAJ5369930.1 hypothetical protein N7496_006022 [Penicillium cataractarum]
MERQATSAKGPSASTQISDASGSGSLVGYPRLARGHLGRQTYWGSFIFNIGAFVLPALYSTLSKLWVAEIDSSQVVTTDVYTYIGVIVEVLNEGFPRSAWLLIGDNATRSMRSRLDLTCTMIAATAAQGFVVMVIFLIRPQSLASAFVPAKVRQSSVTYIRLSSVQFFTSAVEAALSSSTRALDKPDVPLVISSSKFMINILLDLLIISRFRVGHSTPTVIHQAIIRLACDCLSALAGLSYFVLIIARRRIDASDRCHFSVSISALKTLLRPSIYTFMESVIRNAIYLWIVHEIVQLGETYATAWGVFNTIRWGLIMVPVQALETSTLAFVGHNWAFFRESKESQYPKASRKEVLGILRPALMSCLVGLVYEVVLFASLSVQGVQLFAYYLSGSRTVAKATQEMWKVVDWTYIFYGLSYQLAAVLLATSPRWYLYQALCSNIFWMLPWAIFVTKITLPQSSTWTYYAIIFGGANVFDFFDVSLITMAWLYRLVKGKVKINPAASSGDPEVGQGN